MTTAKKNPFDIKLDPEEQEIEDALPDAWEKLPFSANQAEELALSKQAASNYLKKNKVNVSLIQHDIEGLKRIAAREGLPSYKILISSILHKYVAHSLG